MEFKAAILADITSVTGDYASLIVLPLPELLAIAQELGVKTSGSKSKIIGRIINYKTKVGNHV